MSVRLADRSFQHPIGIAKNILVKVGEFTFPVDFIILKIEEDSKVPLILGRPFLHIADAVIRIKQKQLNLGVGTERMTFSIDSAMKQSYFNDETCFSIDVIDEILEEDFDALLDEGSEILHSIEATIIKEKLFAKFDEFMAMNIKENTESKYKTEEIPFEKITFNTDYKIKTSLEEPPSDLELKPLPGHLEYVFFPNWNLPFELMCDASEFAVGAVLGQKDGKHFHPIYFASKTLNAAKKKYPVTKKELMDVVFAFDKFRPYLILSKTVVYTDHSTLRHLFKKQDAKPRLIRWIMLLQEFDIEIKEKKGIENVAADHLSRIENDETSDDSEVNDNFPGKTFMEITTRDIPWFVDFANYLVGDIIPKGMMYQQKNKFFSDLKNYFWEDPYLFKVCFFGKGFPW
ncbi:reverse transcriptase domain-containing protein [Tanacetum coccineum]